MLLEQVAGAQAAALAGVECVAPPLAEVGVTGSSGFDPARALAAMSRWQPHSVILLPQMLAALVAAIEPYYRVPGSPGPGRGLGLSIVREVVEGLGGRIAIASRADGRGTEMQVSLPLA